MSELVVCVEMSLGRVVSKVVFQYVFSSSTWPVSFQLVEAVFHLSNEVGNSKLSSTIRQYNAFAVISLAGIKVES